MFPCSKFNVVICIILWQTDTLVTGLSRPKRARATSPEQNCISITVFPASPMTVTNVPRVPSLFQIFPDLLSGYLGNSGLNVHLSESSPSPPSYLCGPYFYLSSPDGEIITPAPYNALTAIKLYLFWIFHSGKSWIAFFPTAGKVDGCRERLRERLNALLGRSGLAYTPRL